MSDKSSDCEKNGLAEASIQPYRGAPALFANGRPVFPLLMMTSPKGLVELQKLGYEGTHLHTVELENPTGWVGIDRYDYSGFDRGLKATVEADPSALIIPRVNIFAPEEWMAAHPDEIIDYADPESWNDHGWGGPRQASWASEPWRKDACEALRRLVRHARTSSYARNIIGWHIGSGVYGEWHYSNPMGYPDTSKAFVKRYQQWLSKRYPSNTPPPRLPTIQERRNARHGLFHDPVQDKWMMDHAEFLHLQGVEVLLAFAAVVKKESDRKSLVVAFNGYMPDLGINHEADHSGLPLVLRSDDVDILSSPHTYRRRKPGEDASFRGFPGSVRCKGKLWIDEQDDRTSFATNGAEWQKQHTHVKTVAESGEILWRGFAQALAHNAGLWMMDQGAMWARKLEAHFYRDKTLVSAIAQMRRIGDESMSKPRTRVSDIAVVCSYRSRYYTVDPTSEQHPTTVLYANALAELWKSGASFDMYQISEIFEPETPQYKAYIFLDTFFMTDEEFNATMKLRTQGKTLLFFVAPAVVSDKDVSAKRAEELTGMRLHLVKGGDVNGPAMAVCDEKSCVEGAELYRKGPIFFSPNPILPSSVFRFFCKEAGIHVFADTDDVIMVGGGYVAIHASSDGEKTLRSPAPVTWTDERSGTRTGPALEVRLTLKRGETALYSMQA